VSASQLSVSLYVSASQLSVRHLNTSTHENVSSFICKIYIADVSYTKKLVRNLFSMLSESFFRMRKLKPQVAKASTVASVMRDK